jgi:chromosome segregation ATPase
MKAKTTNQLADLARKSEAIGRLKLELGEKTAALFALEAKEKQLSDDLQTTQIELAAKTGALEETERALASARTELTQVTANFNDASVASGSQRVEVVALRAQTEALKGQIDSYEKETKALWDHLNTKTAELEAANQQLAEERGRADNLASRAGELDRQLTAQTAESEVLGGRVQELAARLDEQGRLRTDREGLSQNLRDEATTAQKTETEIRAQLAEMEDRHRLALATIKTEKSLIETELKRSQDERDKLQREIAAAKRDAANAGEYERMENAVLREHIDEVAAEVARLTAALEGPDSPIETILNAGRAAAPAGAPAQRGPKRGAVPRGARADK